MRGIHLFQLVQQSQRLSEELPDVRSFFCGLSSGHGSLRTLQECPRLAFSHSSRPPEDGTETGKYDHCDPDRGEEAAAAATPLLLPDAPAHLRSGRSALALWEHLTEKSPKPPSQRQATALHPVSHAVEEAETGRSLERFWGRTFRQLGGDRRPLLGLRRCFDFDGPRRSPHHQDRAPSGSETSQESANGLWRLGLQCRLEFRSFHQVWQSGVAEHHGVFRTQIQVVHGEGWLFARPQRPNLARRLPAPRHWAGVVTRQERRGGRRLRCRLRSARGPSSMAQMGAKGGPPLRQEQIRSSVYPAGNAG